VPLLGFGVAVLWMLVGRGIRGISHLWRRPQDIVLLPLVTLVTALVALPIKLFALCTMNTQGWLTRSADSVGGEGQSEATLTPATEGASA